MKAIAIPQPGSSTVEFTELPVPDIGDDELLVSVKAVGVGIHDSYFLPADAQYPLAIGIEASGMVEKTGSDVLGYQPGDRITFVSSGQQKGGTWAEYVAVNAHSLILPIPEGMGFPEAAALPVAGNTILKVFRSLAEMPQRGTLFIAGGSGAIGTLAIQLAHQRGWRVGASASEANHAYMHSLGAEKTVDYHDSRWTEQVLQWMPDGVDAMVAVQPGTSKASLPVVKDGGTLISVSGDPLVSERGIHMAGIPYQADVLGELAQLLADVAAGELKVELEQVYPFEGGLDALAKVQTRRARGKSVLHLEDDKAGQNDKAGQDGKAVK